MAPLICASDSAYLDQYLVVLNLHEHMTAGTAFSERGKKLKNKFIFNLRTCLPGLQFFLKLLSAK